MASGYIRRTRGCVQDSRKLGNRRGRGLDPDAEPVHSEPRGGRERMTGEVRSVEVAQAPGGTGVARERPLGTALVGNVLQPEPRTRGGRVHDPQAARCCHAAGQIVQHPGLVGQHLSFPVVGVGGLSVVPRWLHDLEDDRPRDCRPQVTPCAGDPVEARRASHSPRAARGYATQRSLQSRSARNGGLGSPTLGHPEQGLQVRRPSSHLPGSACRRVPWARLAVDTKRQRVICCRRYTVTITTVLVEACACVSGRGSPT